MKQIFEIKRKEFSVIEPLGEHSFKVERKGKIYFLKDYSFNHDAFIHYIKAENKLKTSGIKIPKLYLYDKNKYLVVTEYIEGQSILEMLMQDDLPDIVFEQVFIMNFLMKRNHTAINFDPVYFIVDHGKLIYIASDYREFEEKFAFEKGPIFLWFYGQDFVTYLSKNGYQVDQKRLNKEPGYINKQVALTVVKYYR